MRRRMLLAASCAMLASRAFRLRAAPAETRLALSYATCAAGFTVARSEAQVVFGPAGYGMQLGFRTVGLYGAFFHTNMQTTVQGLWKGTQVAPLHLASQGIWRGTRHETRIAYQDGMPDVQLLVPPAGTKREPVPRALQAHTIDTLSAIALLIRDVEQTGRCDGTAMTFDGRRLSRIEVHTAGQEGLPQTRRSIYSGPAMRYDFTGQMLAGFLRDADRRSAARPHHGSAWLARVSSDGPPVPVRMRFATDWFGDAVMYLTAINPLDASRG